VLKPGDRVMSLGLSGSPSEIKKRVLGGCNLPQTPKSYSFSSKTLIPGTGYSGKKLF